MRKLTCPNFPNTHKKFTVSATERCSWEVDEHGYFYRVLETYDSEAGDDYVCLECGREADVEYTNNRLPENITPLIEILEANPGGVPLGDLRNLMMGDTHE